MRTIAKTLLGSGGDPESIGAIYVRLRPYAPVTVSYTHLTLPTILRV